MATANVLTYAAIFQTQLDQQMVEQLCSGAMEANSSQVRYNGGNTVKIPKLSLEGLGDYNRTNGFPTGAATLTWEDRTFDHDRGKEFNLDAQDIDETGFVLAAGTIMGEFQRTQVAPEVDAARFSKIYALAAAGAHASENVIPEALTVANVFTKLKSEISAIRNVIGYSTPLVCYIGGTAAGLLDRSSEMTRQIVMGQFANGVIDTKVQMLDDVPLFRVPDARFKSAYTFSATNGFAAASGALQLNWIIAPRDALIGVVKTDKIRIFDPDTNQDADAWRIQYRKYHGLWIKDNALAAVVVSNTPGA